MSPNGQRNLFQKGHKKLGGRKKGVPNKMSGAQKQAMIDAAEVIGLDGHGLGGLVGYLARQAIYHPAGFFRLLTRDLRQQQAPIKHTLDFRRLTSRMRSSRCAELSTRRPLMSPPKKKR